MIENEKVLKILEELNITPHSDSWDVTNNLRKNGYFNIKVADGASKICLIFPDVPYVVKWSTCGYDEAMREVEIYQNAVQAHLDKFFPKTVFLTSINGIDFVAQEKIDVTVCNLDFQSRQRFVKISKTALDKIVCKMEHEFKKASPYFKRDLDRTWAKMALVLYGKKACKALCDFVIANKINDLHGANIGYKNNRPIILDFSGYDR